MEPSGSKGIFGTAKAYIGSIGKKDRDKAKKDIQKKTAEFAPTVTDIANKQIKESKSETKELKQKYEDEPVEFAQAREQEVAKTDAAMDQNFKTSMNLLYKNDDTKLADKDFSNYFNALYSEEDENPDVKDKK